MSVHQPYPPQFSQFRMIYTLPTSVSAARPHGPMRPPDRGYAGRPYAGRPYVSGPYGGRPYAPWGRNQNGNPSFYGYSGYFYYLSPYQHPLVVQQASTAASNWFLDAVGKMPWQHIIPSWTEMARMGVRSAQDQLTTSLSKLRFNPPGEEPIRNVAGQVIHGAGRLV